MISQPTSSLNIFTKESHKLVFTKPLTGLFGVLQEKECNFVHLLSANQLDDASIIYPASGRLPFWQHCGLVSIFDMSGLGMQRAKSYLLLFSCHER